MISLHRTAVRNAAISIINRNIQTTTTNCKENTAVARQVKIMQKLLGNRESGSKKRWYPNEGPSQSSLQSQLTSVRDIGKVKRQGKTASRRVNVLNKLFMNHITDQLANGVISEEILGKGLEISRVKVATDFHGVNVYWVAKGTCSDNEIEKTLHRCTGLLRHELSQLRLMGEVPRIHFVKDKTYANLAEVENALRVCDFGDDFEEFVVDNDAEKIRNELGLSSFVEDEDTLPIMRHDVLGLNHKEIMTGILTKMKKSKDAWRTYEMRDGEENDEPVDEMSATPKLDAMRKRLEDVKLNEEGFQKFLQSRNFKKPTPERKIPIKVLEFERPDEGYVDENHHGGGDYLDDVENKK